MLNTVCLGSRKALLSDKFLCALRPSSGATILPDFARRGKFPMKMQHRQRHVCRPAKAAAATEAAIRQREKGAGTISELQCDVMAVSRSRFLCPSSLASSHRSLLIIERLARIQEPGAPAGGGLRMALGCPVRSRIHPSA